MKIILNNILKNDQSFEHSDEEFFMGFAQKGICL